MNLPPFSFNFVVVDFDHDKFQLFQCFQVNRNQKNIEYLTVFFLLLLLVFLCFFLFIFLVCISISSHFLSLFQLSPKLKLKNTIFLFIIFIQRLTVLEVLQSFAVPRYKSGIEICSFLVSGFFSSGVKFLPQGDFLSHKRARKGNPYGVKGFASSYSIHNHNLNSNGSFLTEMQMPDHSYDINPNSLTSSTTGCTLSSSPNEEESEKGVIFSDVERVQNPPKLAEDHIIKLPLRHRTTGREGKPSVVEYTLRDLNRIHTFQRRITEKKNQNAVSSVLNHGHRYLLEEKPAEDEPGVSSVLPGHLMGSLKSGVSLGSGEYFMDVFVGTPPKHFLLILDTGSDLNWIQCTPCYDCFEQEGPHYDPKGSSSFKNISCHDPRCALVSSPGPPQPCKRQDQSCPYFYWYGDSSNTTGDLALETFTVNLTSPNGTSEFKKVENLMFGCGHWNRGLFHGAAGLLGLGRGPLSFSSQIQSLYGHSFSYCLVERNSDPSVSSKLIFGEDKKILAHPELNFTKLVNGKENPVDTFYYVEVKSITVGGETLSIPEETWGFTEDGGGGTIIDSGTTLSYFAEPAYELIKDTFTKTIKNYPLISDFPILKPCYNVSGVDKLEMPSFKIQFKDGAEWNFPTQNYFIWVDQEVVCLAMLGTKRTAFSIIGNYQQQNFHILYDTKKSRLGFAPTRCAEV